MHAVAVVAEDAAHGPALDVAVNTGLPGIDFRGEQRFGRLDHGPGPIIHLLRPGFHMRVVMFPHEPQYSGLELYAVFNGLRNIAARGVRAKHHQHVREAFREHAKVGARTVSPDILKPDTIRAADVDAIEGAGHE